MHVGICVGFGPGKQSVGQRLRPRNEILLIHPLHELRDTFFA